MRKHKSKLNKKVLLIGSLITLVVIIAILELTNTTHLLHKQKVPAIIPTHSNSTAQNNQVTSPNPGSSPVPASNNKAPSSTTSSGQTLIAPFGNFVSNHNPGAKDSNGYVTPTAETSVCDSTPGAVCYIKFTNVDNGRVTQLPTQTVGSDGSTAWNWDVSQDAHLTQGQWQITAVASLNGQTKSTDDTLKLTVL